MNRYPKIQEPFAFWLVRQFLITEERQKEDIKPISNRELFSILSMIIAALVILRIIFQR
jgi:hypothetical protein